jgi:hypothetical protein
MRKNPAPKVAHFPHIHSSSQNQGEELAKLKRYYYSTNNTLEKFFVLVKKSILHLDTIRYRKFLSLNTIKREVQNNLT